MCIEIEKNIVYGKTEKEYLTADIYKPTNQDRSLPVLVLIHGGAFQAGSKEMYVDWGKHLAKENYFVLAVNYSLASLNYKSYPNVLEDIAKALNWIVLQSNERDLDVEKIALIGDSAGAYIASMYTLNLNAFSYKIRAVIGVYGVYDLVEECINPVMKRKVNMFERLLGIPFEGNENVFRNASPINYIDRASSNPNFDTKFFLTYGTNDKIVNPIQTQQFYKALQNAGIPVEIKEFNDLGHFWFNELPGVDIGKVTDYPNTFLYPELLQF